MVSQSVQAAKTNDRRLDVSDSKHLFLRVLEAGSPRSGCLLADLISGEGSFLGLQKSVFSLCPHTVERKIISLLSS